MLFTPYQEERLGDVDNVVLGKFARKFGVRSLIISAVSVLKCQTHKEATAAYSPGSVSSFGSQLARIRKVLRDEGIAGDLPYHEIRVILHKVAYPPSDEDHQE